jgi:L-aminopeptidase/D-esterase-like protein
MYTTLTAIPGLRVGHATDLVGLTGCTVILCDGPDGAGAVGGVDQRGGAPGTRETDLLRPLHLVQAVHAIVLAGGSAFGLAAADGVMRYLRERGVGYPAGPARVPIVPAAILFDLGLGAADAYPDAAMGYAACLAATGAPVAEGHVGAGTGCSVGKALGMAHAARAGIGSACITVGAHGRAPLHVAALMAVNAFGDVVDEAGRVIAGLRPPAGAGFSDTVGFLCSQTATELPWSEGATVIGVVATNARLTKEQANQVAQMAHDGLARAVRPAHTMFDGDTIFALATGAVTASATVVGALAAEVTAQAIRRGAMAAAAPGGLPAAP